MHLGEGNSATLLNIRNNPILRLSGKVRFSCGGKSNSAVLHCKESMIVSDGYLTAGKYFQTSLSNKDLTGANRTPVPSLYPEVLRF